MNTDQNNITGIVFENTFDGIVEHFKPRQVVKFMLNGNIPLFSATVRCVHIYSKEDVRYDLEIWGTAHVFKGIKSKFVSLK